MKFALIGNNNASTVKSTSNNNVISVNNKDDLVINEIKISTSLSLNM